MWLLYADESNLDPACSEFFVYGGLRVHDSKAPSLCQTIAQLKDERGLPADYLLKFNPRHQSLDHEQFKGLKQAVLEAAIEHGAKAIVVLTLHKIAGDPSRARRFAVSTVCYHFDCALTPDDECGLVLLDRFDDKEIDTITREKISHGAIGLPYSGEHRLKRLVGVHYAAIGQSQLCSLTDIFLGSLRWVVNAWSRGEHLESATGLLNVLAPLFDVNNGRVHQTSLFLSPAKVKVSSYRARCEGLAAFFGAAGLALQQDFDPWTPH